MGKLRLTTAQALVKFLDNQYLEVDGVELKFVKGIFAIFGHGNVLGLGQALEQDSGDMRVYQGRNEQGMAHAATGFARQALRRQIIACTSSIGPGAANMITAAGTASANRIPLLQSGKADLIVADITITPERAQVIDFSTPYFVTGQQFLVPAKSPDKLDDYSKARIGAVKGTTGEQALHQRFPQSRVLSYDDIPLALTALRNGNVQAITQDSTILAGLLAEAPDKAKFKILPDLLSKEEIGVGVKKGEPALLKAVNDELVKLEKTGEAAKIYDVWFGPATKTPQPRAFTIEAK